MLKNGQIYQESLEKSVDWLLGQINPEGTVNPVSKGSLAYYKLPWALLLAGKNLEAKGIIDWTVKESMAPDGDFKSEKRQKFHLDYYTYPNAWLCLASHLLSLFDVSYPAWNYIQSHQDPQTGGYCSRAPYNPDGDNLEDAISTAWSSVVGLHLGKLEEAKKAASFLKMLHQVQPDFENNFYYYWSSKRGLIVKKPSEEPDDRFFRINKNEKQENWLYILGATIAFLTKLSLASKNPEHLNLAKTYFNFVEGCDEILYSTESCGKLCYASTNLYHATGEKKYLEAAERFMTFLLKIAEPDGSWIRGGKPTASSTAEFCVWRSNLLFIGDGNVKL